MIIEFSWGTGKMSVDAELWILDIPMTNFRKWVKLFAMYGKPADHEAFLQLLEDQIHFTEVQIHELGVEAEEFQLKAERVIPTHLSSGYCLKQMMLKQKHLNGTKARLKRYRTMYDLLKGRLS